MTLAEHTIGKRLASLDRAAFRQVDNSALVVFRVVFGVLLCYHLVSQLLSGYVYEVFIKPPFTFNFIGFDFLQPLPGRGMYYYFGLMAILALMIAAGAFYRFAITLFTLLWTIIYLMQKSHYNNHYYFILLLCFLMIFLPANRYFSIDVKRKVLVKSFTCPQWVIWLFIAQVAIVYFYAAIAKFNTDWLSGSVIKILFRNLGKESILEPFLHQHYFHLFIAYSGILFDLLLVPLLLWRKTRLAAFVLAGIFHVFNSFAFSIGIFPYLSLGLMLFFIKPAAIRRVVFKDQPPLNNLTYNACTPAKRLWVIYGVTLYLLLQLALPLRPYFYPGNVSWTEEGHRMSWQMMVRGKRGKVHFKVVQRETGKIWLVDPAKDFSPAHVKWIATLPDLMWQYARWLQHDFARKGYQNVQVYVISSVSINGRPPQPLADTTVDLAATTWHHFRHSPWITNYHK